MTSRCSLRLRFPKHNGWDKNDPKDAQVILHMLRIGATQRTIASAIRSVLAQTVSEIEVLLVAAWAEGAPADSQIVVRRVR